jgi:hypothetical protein
MKKLTPEVILAALLMMGLSCFLSVESRADSLALGDHPRIWLTPERLSVLRQLACYDDSGNQIPGCTPSYSWTHYFIDCGSSGSCNKPLDNALRYMITQDQHYANLAISGLMEEINDGLDGSWKERSPRYLAVGGYVKSAAVVYDWLYDQLIQTQRDRIVHYMNHLIYEVYNNEKTIDNVCHDGGQDWAYEKPWNNMHWHRFVTLPFTAVASEGENDGHLLSEFCGGQDIIVTFPLVVIPPVGGLFMGIYDHTQIFDYTVDYLENQSFPYYLENEYGKGGAWHEGTDYGGCKLHMMEALLLIKEAGGPDYFSISDYPKEVALHMIYSLQPGNKRHVYTAGEGASYDFPLGENRIAIMSILATGLNGTQNQAEAEYARFFVNQNRRYAADDKGYRYLTFLFDGPPGDPNFAERDYNEGLPLSYFSPNGWVNSRSSWDDNATSVTFWSMSNQVGPLSTDLVGHQDADQNNFYIYKYDWLVNEVRGYTGYPATTAAHNTFLINGSNQRGSGGIGKVTKFEGGTDYTYAVGDATNAYSNVDKYVRELVHVMPDHVVIYDRVDVPNSTDIATYLLHVHNEPRIDSTDDIVEATNGGGKIFQKTLLPSDPSFAVTYDYDGSGGAEWRVDIEYPTTKTSYRFLHVLYATEDTTQNMVNTELIETSSGDFMQGTEIEGIINSINQVVMYSCSGSDITNASYSTTIFGQTRHLVMNARPSEAYEVTLDGSFVGTYRASGHGIVEFQTRGPGTVTISQGAMVRYARY